MDYECSDYDTRVTSSERFVVHSCIDLKSDSGCEEEEIPHIVKDWGFRLAPCYTLNTR